MNLLPQTKEEFSTKEYWDSFFKKRGGKAFEWYGEYPELSEYLHKYIKVQDNVVIIGCGNSTLGQDLYDIGYKKITNIDISDVVVRQMLSKNRKERPSLEFIQMDALNMSFDNDQFSVVLDKGTLDALMPDDCEKTVEKIRKYFSEIDRVLKVGGRYICVSLLQEHILKMVVNYFPLNNWLFRVVRCFEAEKKALEDEENALPVFILVCTKFKSLPRMVLEVNLSSQPKMQKCDSAQEIIEQISTAQRAAFICSGLRKSTLTDNDEVSVELFEPGKTDPRYTIFVVDVPFKSTNSQYAAFVVPQGRETEWLFSTKEGRKNLAKMTNQNRLTVITLHRGQLYESLDSVQNELTDVVCRLAPASLKKKKIPFLSLGADVGSRNVRHKGNSKLSGDYVIEDVETDEGEKFRRLYYLSSQLVIQSEARLKTIKKKNVSKEVPDLNHLTCNHHIYMTVSAFLTCAGTADSSLGIIGLGGGGLCSFLHKFLPTTDICAVDIDEEMLKIASEWFGFQQDDKLKAKIQDGLEYLKELGSKGQKINAILFDVDSKDNSIGMSCPPKQFLEEDVLQNVSKIIDSTGIFVLNMVLRDQSLRPSVIKNLKREFKNILCYKLEEDLNEIITCFNSTKDFIPKLKDACGEINKFFKRHNVKCHVDTQQFIKEIKTN